jgi:transmembrane sensor
MRITEERIVDLITRERRGELSENETEELENWKSLSEKNRQFADQFKDEAFIVEQLKQRSVTNLEAKVKRFMSEAIGEEGEEVKPVYALYINRKRRWLRLAAAVVVGVLAVAGYAILQNKDTVGGKGEMITAKANEDVLPGGDRAVLILENGSRVLLDSTVKGKLAEQSGSIITKEENGSIVYNVDKKARAEVTFNTLITPRGGQYRLVLPDGSKVWLNAASSIRYPVFFVGTERRVEITGEAYFEVEKNAAMPFKVHFGDATVEVLGTHFNINTYGDEQAFNTTLLEGSIRISSSPAVSVSPALQSVVLKPGQQATLNRSNRINVNNDVDMDQVMAWKDGYFNFDNADLRTIMKYISRWYDRDIVYETNDDHHFSFKLPRNVPVSKLLSILERTGAVKFSINDKEIRVIK